ncbi:hypothetical protein ACFLQ0_04275 [Nitrospinota bacterium]
MNRTIPGIIRKTQGLLTLSAAACFCALLAGCAGSAPAGGKYISKKHGFEIRTPKKETWRRTPDVADILALNDPSTSVLYFDNPYTGGIISLQVLPRHYPSEGRLVDEVRYIYRRMLSTPHNDMRTEFDGKFVPLGRAVRFSRTGGAERAEFFLRGAVGRRPSALARDLARRRLESTQPFGGPRTRREVKAEREFRYEQLTPAYTSNYRGKVVVFLRGGVLYEFYYIDHRLAFEKGLRDFDAFVGSFKLLPRGIF